ncbi:class I SAM-dependent methyltransferase [Gandjariella thermophila]|uniref:Methyltransferase n=1 Tax=Gandjariella thermophila TaxID=1931992 RepID=A0A4D4J9Q8_9PSEU|nr:class I SAM-dependent methyltransferase [Gandjariella thermophila]GDY31226.1 hypothetical protein GTS_28590 [Gandjariella thermophila]
MPYPPRRRKLHPDHLRRALRDKALRVVDEVVSRYHARQVEELRAAVESLRGELEEARRSLREEVHHAVRQYEIRARRDMVYAGEQEAARQSARFVREHMPAAHQFGNPQETLEYALTQAPDTGGLALEFGVYEGTTLKAIAAARQGRNVYGFDSFEGLPENWRNGFPAGTFAMAAPPEVPGAELVVGWFDDTLGPFLAEHPEHVDFLHVDCDLYASAKTVLDLVGPRLRPGSVIVFDEFFNFPGWPEHEYRAWREYVERTGLTFDYLAYTYDNEQVVVRVTTV